MNEIKLCGTIVDEPVFSHVAYGEKFYNFYIECQRLSGTCDVLPCLVSEVLVNEIAKGEKIKVYGQIRTFNEFVDGKINLNVNVFVNSVGEYDGQDGNFVEMDGYIRNDPFYRGTTLGREISDFLLRSKRERTKKADCIPCIVWGRSARRVSDMQIGTKLLIKGRLQSRECIKKLADGTLEKKMVYEVSANKVYVLEEKEE